MIVFDNASEEHLEDLERHWPSGESGAVLITTRNKGLAHHFSASKSFDVDFLDQSQGVEFLRSLFSRSESDKMLLDDDSLVGKIVTMLDGLPLALSQMAGFMITSRCPCSEFVRLYQHPKNVGLLHETPTVAVGSTSHYHQTIASVWKISISSLSARALALLETIAFFDPDGQ